MTTISANMVRELREKTGAGMMDCKNALAEAGDMEAAIKILREKGLARAAKKTSRVAAEGLVDIVIEGARATMVEVNCETDFVARNDDFKNLVHDLAKTALNFKGAHQNDCEIEGSELNAVATKSGQSVESVITDKIATIGEKIELRRFALLTKGHVYGAYIHQGGSIGVLLECELDNPSLKGSTELAEAARDIAMHVAASSPSFISENQIPESWLKSERDIFVTQVRASGKPENMIEKIVDGKMAKHKKDFCLLDQPFVKNPDMTVQGMLNDLAKRSGAKMTVKQMARFKVGEGIEKAHDNLAEEVKKMTA
jgi:elongation factor Ts